MFLFRKDPGKRLRMMMSEADVNVNELAGLSGKSRTTISRLRSGAVSKPNRETAADIANALSHITGRRIKADSIWPDIHY